MRARRVIRISQLLNVVYQAKQFPLGVHFHAAAEREAIAILWQALTVTSFLRTRLTGG